MSSDFFVTYLPDRSACEISDRHMASDGYRLTKGLDTLNLVHGLSREIRLTAMRA